MGRYKAYQKSIAKPDDHGTRYISWDAMPLRILNTIELVHKSHALVASLQPRLVLDGEVFDTAHFGKGVEKQDGEGQNDVATVAFACYC